MVEVKRGIVADREVVNRGILTKTAGERRRGVANYDRV
jgi:hypothetical protein